MQIARRPLPPQTCFGDFLHEMPRALRAGARAVPDVTGISHPARCRPIRSSRPARCKAQRRSSENRYGGPPCADLSIHAISCPNSWGPNTVDAIAEPDSGLIVTLLNRTRAFSVVAQSKLGPRGAALASPYDSGGALLPKSLRIAVVLAVGFMAISAIRAPMASADDVTKSVTILDAPPVWSANAGERPASSTPTATNSVSAVKRTATGTDCNAESNYSVTCRTGGLPTANSSAAPSTTGSDNIIWSDSIQTGSSPWGFRFICEHPIGTPVVCSDSNGANISIVSDPLGGPGKAIRHYVVPTGGGRAQLGTSTFDNTALANQLASRSEVWIEQEMYIPGPIPTSTGKRAWISIMDVHSTGDFGANRWHTNPGLFLCSAALGCSSGDAGKLAARNLRNNKFVQSSFHVPIDQWFKVQVHVPWSTTPVPVTFFVDGKIALQIKIPTKSSDHTVFEWYSKLYGSNSVGSVWTPTPLIRYTRNVRISDAFIQ